MPATTSSPAVLLLLVAATGASTARAEVPYQVADLETLSSPFTSGPALTGLVEVAGGVGYFQHDDGIHGLELWRTDGTASGTYLLLDLCPGICGSEHLQSYDNLHALGDRLLFSGNDGVHGTELWVTDGTALGTEMVRDILPGFWSSAPSVFAESAGQLFFVADDGVHGRELWRSDGTAKGTFLVADVRSGTGGCVPTFIAPAGALLFFDCSEWQAPRGLWVTDGTSGGTTQLTTQTQWSRSTFKSRGFIALQNGKLLYAGEDLPDAALELWISDGTIGGTQRLLDLHPGPAGSGPFNFLEFDGEILFTADSDGFGPSQELWRTDGTAAGTLPIVLPPGVEPHLSGGQFTIVGDTLFFAAFEATIGAEPWKFQGGTFSLVQDIRPGPDSSINSIVSFPLFNSTLFATASPWALFLADDGLHGIELWRASSSTSGASLVSELAPGDDPPNLDGYVGFHPPSIVGSRLILRAHDPVAGYRLYGSDGEPSGSGYFDSISGDGSSFRPTRSDRFFFSKTGPFCFEPAGDRLVFGATAANPDRWTTWASDGSTAGTLLLSEPDTASNFESDFLGCTQVGDGVVFAGTDAQTSGIWFTRGFPETTDLIFDAGSNPVTLTSPLRPYFTSLGLEIVFGFDGSLYLSDGTEEGTISFYELAPVSYGGLTSSEDQVYFSDYELHSSDGTFDGTTQIVDLNGSSPSFPSDLTVMDPSRLLFVAFEDTTGEELWVTDETELGAHLVRDIRAGESGGLERPFSDYSVAGLPRRLATVGAWTFLAANDGEHGTEAWVSDGTALGTHLLMDIYPGEYPSTPRNLTRFGDRVFFTAESELEGLELWATDGTAPGTQIVRDIAPGGASSIPEDLVVRDGTLYFSAWTATHGREAWKSDGTTGGTIRITDIAPGPKSSSPQRFARAGNRLFLSATDQVHGYELWAISDDGSIPLFLDGFESESPIRWSAVEP